MRPILLLLLLAGPAPAQERITPERFLDFAEDRVLDFSVPATGALVGREQFVGRDRSLWARTAEACVAGRVWVEDETVCFRYEDRPEIDWCWWPMIVEGRLHVMSTIDFEMQVVREAKGPPPCGTPMS